MAKCKSIWNSSHSLPPSIKKKNDKIDFFKKHYTAEILNEVETAFRTIMERGTGPGPCLRCGADTELLNGRYGKFYGCVTFPECKGSRDYDDQDVKILEVIANKM
jgi:ssDNA-binding Zn-finger/Zn-ribbon topoisomerase 1